jgi:hypothetical protein
MANGYCNAMSKMGYGPRQPGREFAAGWNNLSKTPGMGWRSWYASYAAVTQQSMEEAIDALAAKNRTVQVILTFHFLSLIPTLVPVLKSGPLRPNQQRNSARCARTARCRHERGVRGVRVCGATHSRHNRAFKELYRSVCVVGKEVRCLHGAVACCCCCARDRYFAVASGHSSEHHSSERVRASEPCLCLL